MATDCSNGKVEGLVILPHQYLSREEGGGGSATEGIKEATSWTQEGRGRKIR